MGKQNRILIKVKNGEVEAVAADRPWEIQVFFSDASQGRFEYLPIVAKLEGDEHEESDSNSNSQFGDGDS